MDLSSRRWPPVPDARELELLTDVARSRVWTDGPRTAAVERRMSELTGSPHTVAFNSCTSALHAALLAMGCVRGTRVAAPAFTFAGTVTGAAHIGAELLFADVDPDTLTLTDPAAAAEIVIAVDLHGVPHGLDRGRAAGLPILTDACQSLGSLLGGAHIGATGTHAWSFSSAKMVAAPDGGAVTTDDAGIAERLRELRDYGVPAGASRSNGAVERPGGHNWRPSELSMAMVAHRLDGLDRWAARAREVTARLHAAMDRLGIWRQRTPEPGGTAWHKVRFGPPDRAAGRAAGMERTLAAAGVPTHRWGGVPLNRHPAFNGPGHPAGTPVAERVAAGTLCLGTEAAPPMTWSDDEVDRVCHILETSIGS
jgi:perosamine synthetase